VELTKTIDTPVATPTPSPTPTASATPAPTATPTPVVVPEPSGTPIPVVRPPRLWVRGIRVAGRTVTLWLVNAGGARVHVAIVRSGRVVTSSHPRRAPARGALALRLHHALRLGRYTIEVIAQRGARRTVVRLRLRCGGRGVRFDG
jgi:hypothetical protein